MIEIMNRSKIKRVFLGFCLGIISITLLNAQNSNPNSPKLHCLNVFDNGVIRVTWAKPTNIDNFNRYEVWYATGSPTSPYTLACSSNADTLSNCENPSWNGLINTYYFYVCQVKTDGIRYYSDTLSNMFNLLVTSANGTVELRWTSPRSPLRSEDETQYKIYKKNPGDSPTSNWNRLIGSLSTNSSSLVYKDTVMVCNDTMRYKVTLGCNYMSGSYSGYCTNGSRIAKILVNDKIGPNVPRLDSVSVDGGQIVLGWQPSRSTDTWYYIIYQQINGGWVEIDTVYGINNTFWTDPNNDPANGIYKYLIAAVDTCNMSGTMLEQHQNNIQLITNLIDDCSGVIDFSWNSYDNMTGTVKNYEIWMSKNGSAYTNVGQTTGTTYHYSNLQNHNHYDFKVKAVNQNSSIKASSNVISFDIEFDEKKDLCYITRVSVINGNYIDIEILTSGDTIPFSHMELYKSEGNGETFNLLTTLSYVNRQALYHYIDNNVTPNAMMYYYKVIIYGTCSPTPATSNIAHTILLQGETNESHVNALKWNNYGEWDGIIEHFTLFRKGETDGIFIPVNDVTPNAIHNQYSDDVSDMFNYGSLFQYQVTAYETSNKYGITASSTSNTVELQQMPATYIPNAFTPNRSINNVFKPVNSFVPLSDYHFYIYNRYGSLIFFSNNPYEGWDGYAKNGNLVTPGVYIWRIKYTYDRDKLYDNVGTVTVIH
ncbi:MAG: gliding motility-associated C-terminal domain-containing protein [Bacteroidales bacterium]|jgi:gliding motility-associated-like protein|nr:gliding motility-associated C-terminal domain-containing protein [Bacteroidales bacterium]